MLRPLFVGRGFIDMAVINETLRSLTMDQQAASGVSVFKGEVYSNYMDQTKDAGRLNAARVL